MVRKFLYLIVSVLVIASCGDNSTKNGELTEENFTVPESIADQGPLVIDQNAMDDIIKSFSNPVEMAALVEDLGVPFSMKYLCPVDVTDEYNTNFKKALGLGILSADLGYLNIYEKTSSIVSYITVIKRLADGIQVGQFFDFNTLKTLATNNEHLDSLMYLSINSFNQMDEHLRESNRSNLSILVVTGMWIEGLYLATQVYRESTHTDVSERIGEQQIILNDVLLILNNYKNDKNFASLISELTELKEVYDGVTIRYEVGEPVSTEIDGMLVIQQTDKSFVEITDEQLNLIITTTERIRNKLIDL